MQGQISFVIIIGILLLVAFGFLFYIASMGKIGGGETAIVKQNVEKVASYVTDCLYQKSVEGLLLLGNQGGVIYISQGGLTADSLIEGTDYLVENNAAKIFYGQMKPTGKYGRKSSIVPKYPWDTYPYSSLTNSSLVEIGNFGTLRLPLIEGTAGMEEQLENYVINKMPSCLDFSLFGEEGVAVVAGDMNASSVMSGDVLVKLDYPLNISQQDTKTMLQEPFIVTIPVRMLQIREFARKNLDEDAVNIKYDLSRSANASLSLSINRNAYQHDDAIEIIDAQSSIDARQFIFKTARQNRAPALYYVKSSEYSGKKTCKDSMIELNQMQSSAQLRFNAGTCPPGMGYSSFSITLRADDPDEDPLEFNAAIGNANLNSQRYIVSAQDVMAGILDIRLEVTDGQVNDYQDIKVIAG